MIEPELRVYLAGSVCLERDGCLLRERDLPGRQGRVALVILAAEHRRTVTRDELVEELWGSEPPPAWDAALRALVSKLRGALNGLDSRIALESAFGCYQVRLPAGTWLDLEAAADAAHLAESLLRSGSYEEANGWALVANAVTRRPFLPGEDGPWVTRIRTELRAIRVRALECRAEVLLGKRDHSLAARDAEEVLALEPFRETAYRLLMRAHTGEGNPAEALRAYERCRSLLSEDLGASPSAETEALYLEVLRGEG